MALKNHELDRYYTEIFATCASPGFKSILEIASEMRKNYDSVRNASNEAELFTNRGRLDILDWLSKLHETHEYAYNSMEAAEAEQDD